MKTFARLVALCLALAFPGAVAGQQKTATTVAYGHSVQLQPSEATFVSGVGNVTTFFSTFNGTSGPFLIDHSGPYVSGELRPRLSTPGLYEGSYAQATPLQTVDYGSYTLNLPSTDTDNNGILDVLQYGRNGTFSATGSGYSTPSGLPFSISIQFNRAANTGVGTYTATTVNAAGQSNSVSGVYGLPSYHGQASYVRDDQNSLAFTLAGTTLGGAFAGSTSFVVDSTDKLSYSAFTIKRDDGITLSAAAGSLTRAADSSIYRGTLVLSDGLPETAWADFRSYVLEITDSNDEDRDGIPDLTDLDPPTISKQPIATLVEVGRSAMLFVEAAGSKPLTYQWYKDGEPIAGATTSSYLLPSASQYDGGYYWVKVTNSVGNATSLTVILTVTPVSSGENSLNALSVRSHSGTGADTLITGIAVAGAGTKKLVVRGIGPSLAAHGVQGYLTDPQLHLYSSSGVLLETNDNWGGRADLSEAFTKTGLAPLPPTSKDAALLLNVPSSVFTTHVSASSGGGIALIEVYDNGDPDDDSRLSALSVRGPVGRGASVLIAGFVISGSGAKRLVIRGVGPALAAFGVTGALADPRLKLFNSSGFPIGENDNWGGSFSLSEAFRAVGLSALPTGSKDAALLVTLPVGLYTVHLSGVADTTGVGLIELYEAGSQ